MDILEQAFWKPFDDLYIKENEQAVSMARTGDHDMPYFYRAPTVDAPGPFTEMQLARLYVLKGKVRDSLLVGGKYADDTFPMGVTNG